jgi:hypothetical protein
MTVLGTQALRTELAINRLANEMIEFKDEMRQFKNEMLEFNPASSTARPLPAFW